MPMAMEHFLPGFALPAGMPMHAPYLNMPVGHYQYPHNAFPAPVSTIWAKTIKQLELSYFWVKIKVLFQFQLPVPTDVLPQVNLQETKFRFMQQVHVLY